MEEKLETMLENELDNDGLENDGLDNDALGNDALDNDVQDNDGLDNDALGNDVLDNDALDNSANNKNDSAQDFILAMKNGLGLKDVNILTYSPLTLAYIGDDAYDLVIRTFLINQGNMQVNKINKRANSIVKAETQSKMVRVIEPILSDEERAVYKRGRNAKSATTAKNASVNDYRRATGFEALIGYLYLLGRFERMIELIKISLVEIGEL